LFYQTHVDGISDLTVHGELSMADLEHMRREALNDGYRSSRKYAHGSEFLKPIQLGRVDVSDLAGLPLDKAREG
jgi:hypothetical protein